MPIKKDLSALMAASTWPVVAASVGAARCSAGNGPMDDPRRMVPDADLVAPGETRSDDDKPFIRWRWPRDLESDRRGRPWPGPFPYAGPG